MVGAGAGAGAGACGTDAWWRWDDVVQVRVCYGAVGSVADERRGGGLLELYAQPQTASWPNAYVLCLKSIYCDSILEALRLVTDLKSALVTSSVSSGTVFSAVMW